MSGPLLNYAFQPSPNPLQADTEATLTLVAANDGSELVQVSSIVVSLPVGKNAEDLTLDPASVEVQVPAGWNADQQGGEFTLTPVTPASGTIGQGGLAFVFSAIAVNDQPGPFSIPIAETASERSQPSAERSVSLPLVKFPAQFSVGDLTAQPIEVEVGASTTLMWAGSPASYTLEFDADGSGNTSTIPVGDSGPYVSPALTALPVVVFTLVVEVTVAGSDQPLVLERQVTVQVAPRAPAITEFRGSIEQLGDGNTQVGLSWKFEGAETGDLTGFPSPVDPTGSAPVVASVASPLSSTYSLTVANDAGSVESTVTLEWGAGPSAPAGNDPWAIAVSPDNRFVYVADAAGSTVFVIAVDTLTTMGPPVPVIETPACVGVSPDGSRLYVGSYSGGVQVLDTPSLTQVGDVIATGQNPVGLAVSPDGSQVVVANFGDDTITVVDTAALTPTSVSVSPMPYDAVFSPDGTRIYVVTLGVLFVALDSSTFEPVGQPIVLGPVDRQATAAVAAAPDGTRVFAAVPDGSLWSIDAATLETVGEPLALGGQPGGIAVSLDGALLFVSDVAGATVSVVDTAAFALVGTISVDSSPVGVCVAADNSRVFTVNSEAATVSALVPVRVTGGTSG